MAAMTGAQRQRIPRISWGMSYSKFSYDHPYLWLGTTAALSGAYPNSHISYLLLTSMAAMTGAQRQRIPRISWGMS